MLKGLRTVIYHVEDLDQAKAWYAKVLGKDPYFAEPFYVGFSVGGFELGLDPDMSGVSRGDNAVAYWGVRGADMEETDIARRLFMAASLPFIVLGGLPVLV